MGTVETIVKFLNLKETGHSGRKEATPSLFMRASASGPPQCRGVPLALCFVAASFPTHRRHQFSFAHLLLFRVRQPLNHKFR